MAIVATEDGGLIPCPGRSLELPDGRDAVRALSWDDVTEILKRFESLKPNDPDSVTGQLLQLESQNFKDGTRRQLYCLAVSAKRNVLLTLDDGGHLGQIVKASQHGLDLLLPPVEPEDPDRSWTDEVWTYLIREVLGIDPEVPEWFQLPTVSRATMSSPQLLEAFEQDGIPYAEQVKPFNFLLSVPVVRGGYPEGADPSRFSLIPPL